MICSETFGNREYHILQPNPPALSLPPVKRRKRLGELEARFWKAEVRELEPLVPRGSRP